MTYGHKSNHKRRLILEIEYEGKIPQRKLKAAFKGNGWSLELPGGDEIELLRSRVVLLLDEEPAP